MTTDSAPATRPARLRRQAVLGILLALTLLFGSAVTAVPNSPLRASATVAFADLGPDNNLPCNHGNSTRWTLWPPGVWNFYYGWHFENDHGRHVHYYAYQFCTLNGCHMVYNVWRFCNS